MDECSVSGTHFGARLCFRVNTPEGPVSRCLGHTVSYGPLLRRSLATALVVGTVLVAINQSTPILQGRMSAALAARIALTCFVPFCVAMWGALMNSRVRATGTGASR
ncbi:MAG: hypothetical protein FJ317_00875 [SAR202 cluster bacterium]|nr:hypothetical protein [SAR202 cluster bacterium]